MRAGEKCWYGSIRNIQVFIVFDILISTWVSIFRLDPLKFYFVIFSDRSITVMSWSENTDVSIESFQNNELIVPLYHWTCGIGRRNPRRGFLNQIQKMKIQSTRRLLSAAHICFCYTGPLLKKKSCFHHKSRFRLSTLQAKQSWSFRNAP